MSRAVFLKCKTCDVDAGGEGDWRLNHGDSILRRLWSKRSAIAAFYAATWHYDREELFGHQSTDDRGAWIAAHVDHEVVLADEYGDEEPIPP